jgi:hypothetical protein
MSYTKIQIVFDANEPEKLGGFWALALGYVRDPIAPEFATVARRARRAEHGHARPGG